MDNANTTKISPCRYNWLYIIICGLIVLLALLIGHAMNLNLITREIRADNVQYAKEIKMLIKNERVQEKKYQELLTKYNQSQRHTARLAERVKKSSLGSCYDKPKN